MAEAPLGDATHGSPGGIAMYNGASAMAFRDNFQKSQDTLWTLAADTGGKALLDYNDLTKGMVQAQQAISSYYIDRLLHQQRCTGREIPAHQNLARERP